MSINQFLLCLSLFSFNSSHFPHVLGWALGLSSLFIFPPLIGEASWSGQLTARSGASHRTQKYLFAIIGIFFSFSAALSTAPAETALGFWSW